MKLLLKIAIGFFLFVPVSSFSACLKKATLGEFHLGEWSDADRTFFISDTVGNVNRKVSAKNLKKRYKKLLRQCDKKARRLIIQGEDHFPEQARQLRAWYLEGAELCKESFTNNYNMLLPLMCEDETQTQERIIE